MANYSSRAIWRLLNVAWGFLIVSCAIPPTTSDNWIDLFNGNDLTGWKGDPSVWKSENGYISGKATRVAQNTYLVHETSFSDFVLEVKVLIINAGSAPDSGIQYRSSVTDAATWRVAGYQADIGIDRWGELVDEEGRGVLQGPIPQVQQVAKYGEWNQYRITAVGTKLEHELNGIKAVSYNDKDQKNHHLDGIIAFQYREPGENYEIRFKDIRIRTLKH